MRRLLIAGLVAAPLFFASHTTWAQEPFDGPLAAPPAARVQAHTLSNEAIIKMSKAGLDDELIIQTVRTQPGDYKTSPDDLIALKDAGVQQSVISAMVAQASGMKTRTAETVSLTPVSPVVDDVGVYFKMDKNTDWAPMPLERVNYRDGGATKNVLTDGIFKKDKNGIIAGPNGKLQLKPGDKILIFAPEGVTAEEYMLIRFKVKGDRREFRTETGGVFHSQTGADRDAVEFSAQKVATHMYEFAVPDNIGPGEYGVLPPGGANQRGMGNVGKMYTFWVGK